MYRLCQAFLKTTTLLSQGVKIESKLQFWWSTLIISSLYCKSLCISSDIKFRRQLQWKGHIYVQQVCRTSEPNMVWAMFLYKRIFIGTATKKTPKTILYIFEPKYVQVELFLMYSALSPLDAWKKAWNCIKLSSAKIRHYTDSSRFRNTF